MKTEVGVRGFFFSSFFPTFEARAPKSMVEDGENGASAGRVQGGDDAPAAHARPSVGMATIPECQDSALLSKQVRIVSVDVCGF